MAEQVPEDDSLLGFGYDDQYRQQSQQQQHHHHQQQPGHPPGTEQAGHERHEQQQQEQPPQERRTPTRHDPVRSPTAGRTQQHQQQQAYRYGMDTVPHASNLPPPGQHYYQQQRVGPSSPAQNRMESQIVHPQPLPSPPMAMNPQTPQHHQQQQQQPKSPHQQQPFSYVPTVASTVPVHSNARSRGPRRRRTSSKRSLEEMILESTIPTSITTGQGSQQRNGPQIGLVTSAAPGASGMMSPSLGGSSSGGGPILPLTVPEPPLATATPANPNAMQSDPQPRPKKKSKYSTEQDNIILQLKKEGKSWSDISKAANCGNALAARNRYQVLIGQQGGGAVVWDHEDALSLKAFLEEGERAKWDFIASELSRMRSKDISAESCQRKVKEIFENEPGYFGLVVAPPNQPLPSGLSGQHPYMQQGMMQSPQQPQPQPQPQPQLQQQQPQQPPPPQQHQPYQLPPPQQYPQNMEGVDPFGQLPDFMRR